MDAADTLLQLRGIRKSYNVGAPNEAEVLHGLDLRVDRGEFVALIGPSGSGKSTLLNIVGLLERPTSGTYRLDGEEVAALDDGALTLRRRRTLGFVFQFHHLLPAFSALENVTLPALMAEGTVTRERRQQAQDLLAAVGLAAAMDKRPSQLSGGMQQRVAIARALIHNPALVLADEPTASLDTERAYQVVETFAHLIHENNRAGIMVTHDLRMCQFVDRVLQMQDGKLVRVLDDRDEILELAMGTIKEH